MNEEWQQRYDEVLKERAEDKKYYLKVIQENAKNLCDVAVKKCQEDIDEHVSKAIAETKHEMTLECSKVVDDELAQQHIKNQEFMEVTLKNIEANGRDRMDELRNQCVKAMDLQSDLMMCRQITELMHLMSVEKQYWRAKLDALRDEYENKIFALQNQLNSFVSELSRGHQSNSIIIALWKKFFECLYGVNVNGLSRHERSIFDALQRIQRDLIENFDDNSNGTFIIHEQDKSHVNKSNDVDDDVYDDWNRNMNECLARGNFPKDSSVAVNWQRQKFIEFDPIEDSFMSSIFHRMSQADAGDLTLSKIALSIIAMVREFKDCDDDDKVLMKMIMSMLRKMTQTQDALSSLSTDMIPLHKTDSLQIIDSVELIEKKRVS